MTAELVGVTIGIGEEHKRLAQIAAERMRCYTGLPVQILSAHDLRRCGFRDPNHLKFRLFDLVDAENILYFDGDVFCLRPWNPWPLANNPAWVAVRGFWFDERVRHLGRYYGFGAEIFNGGFFLCNRTHHREVLGLAEALQPSDGRFLDLVNPDEIALSTALHILGVPFQALDRRYNWIQYGRGNLANHADVILAHACDAGLRLDYQEEKLFPAIEKPEQDSMVWKEFAGKTFIYDRVGYDLRPLLFREDGTLADQGGNAERYYLAPCHQGTGKLVIGSVFDETCVLFREPDGVWRGRWSAFERMPVTLTKHRAQVLIDLLADRMNQPLIGAEVGVFQGESSEILLQELPGLHLYLIDPWRSDARDSVRSQEECDLSMSRTVERTGFAATRRTLVPCDHARAVDYLPNGLDLIFLDGDHSEAATRDAIERWWPKLAPEGLLTGHDYGNPNYPGVKLAVDGFARSFGLHVRTGSDMVWYLERNLAGGSTLGG